MKEHFETVVFENNLPAKAERYSVRIDMAAHWHKEPELLYLSEGVLTLTVSERKYTLEADGIFLINAQLNHRISGSGKLLCVHLSDEYAKKFGFDITNAFFEPEKGSGAENELRSLLWLFNRTFSENEYPELIQYSLATDIIRVLVSECVSAPESAPLTSSKVSTRNIKAAMEYIENHYNEEITQTEVARLLNLHPVYLSVRFKKVTGIEFKEYINQVRMKHALEALLVQDMTVDKAAAAGGFPSKRNFITKCKRAYNLTPLQLKEKYRNTPR